MRGRIGRIDPLFSFFMVMNCGCLMWRELLVVALPYGTRCCGSVGCWVVLSIVRLYLLYGRFGRLLLWGKYGKKSQKRYRDVRRKRSRKKVAIEKPRETETEGLRSCQKLFVGAKRLLRKIFVSTPLVFI